MASKKAVSRQELKKFISLVRKSPAIYDPSHADYKDAPFQEHVWIRIAEMMGRDDISALEWKKKWKNQRDAYVKKKRLTKTTKSGQAAVNKQKWPLMGIMSFLDRFSEGISTDSNQEHPTERDSDDSFTLEDGETVGVSERSGVAALQLHNQKDKDRAASPTSSTYSAPLELSTRSQLTTKPILPTTVKGQSRKRPVRELEDTQIDKDLVELINVQRKQREELRSQIKTESATKSVAQSFFEACALKMEKLPRETQSFLQLQITQLFFNAENPDIPPIPITPLPRKQTVNSASPPNQFVCIDSQNAPNTNSTAVQMTKEECS